MDLSAIENWTREMLEAEAKRRGIKSPMFRTHAELVRLILRHQYGDRLAAGRERFARSKRTFEEARSLFGTAVGAALSSLPEPMGGLLRMRTGGTLPGTEPAPPAPRTHVVPPTPAPESAAPEIEAAHEPRPSAAAEIETAAVAETVAETETETETETAAVAETETETETVAAAVAVAEPEREPPATLPPGVIPTPAPAPAAEAAPPLVAPAWPDPPPPVREASTHTFEQEPIRTRSMARLLATQGHRERALAIYEELCARNSEDRDLRGEADRLRDGDALDASALPRPSERPAPLPERDDRIECRPAAGAGFRLRWDVSEDGQRRARAVLGHDGELAVRLVTIRPDPDRVVRSEITEHGPVHASGEWTADLVEGTARCLATIGLRDGNRFVSIAHARPAE